MWTARFLARVNQRLQGSGRNVRGSRCVLRKPDREACGFAGGAHLDAAPMLLDDVPHDVEPEAHAGLRGARVVAQATAKRLEQVRKQIGRDGSAMVFDFENHGVVLLSPAEK